jgi:hypothetical protein
VATWFSEEEAEHDSISVESAQAGRVLIKPEHPHSKEDKPNLNKTEEESALDQPILEDYQTAPLSNEVAGGNAKEHLSHPDGILTRSEMDEGDSLSAEGRQTNIDKITQQLPVSMKNQVNGGNEEEGARTREAVCKSTRIAARG